MKNLIIISLFFILISCVPEDKAKIYVEVRYTNGDVDTLSTTTDYKNRHRLRIMSGILVIDSNLSSDPNVKPQIAQGVRSYKVIEIVKIPYVK